MLQVYKSMYVKIAHCKGGMGMKFSEATAEQVTGVSLGVFSLLLYFVLIPWQIADVKVAGVTPRFLPEALAIFMLILSICLFVNGYGKRTNVGQKYYSFAPKETALVVKSLLILSGYIVLLEVLGYLLTTIAALGLLMYMYGQRRIKILIPVTIGLPVVIYLFFTKVLQIVLP